MIYELILLIALIRPSHQKKDVKIKTIINLEMAMILKVKKLFKHLLALYLLVCC